jgi:NAD(P)-dependent dehydrogenase (short-subunit alcohol dehydrogenase family)
MLTFSGFPASTRGNFVAQFFTFTPLPRTTFFKVFDRRVHNSNSGRLGIKAQDVLMARVFITGSADGLGKMAAELLIEQGHVVVLHARHEARAKEVSDAIPRAEIVVIGDLSSIAQTKAVADQVNAIGSFDAIIHNAGVGYREPKRLTEDGLPHVFAINTLATYILSAMIKVPKRLVYLSSGMHHGAGTDLSDLTWQKRRWNGSAAYAESKFHDVLLAFAMARRFPNVRSNALEPGWVPTKMGGSGAPDDLDKGHRTQVWLATSNEPASLLSGQYFFHQRSREPNPEAYDVRKQDELLAECARISGIDLP